MSEIRSFSQGVDGFLNVIRPHSRSETQFPRTLKDDQIRRKSSESLHTWFVRMVDESCKGDIEQVAIEDRLAIFARFRWNKEELIYANIQTIITETSLEDYYLSGAEEAMYMRLDHDSISLGDPFSHPLPHIQFEGSLSPRVALEGGNSGNVIVDYLEFLYRNYFPEKWLAWVKNEWAKESISNDNNNPLTEILGAFEKGQFSLLRDLTNELERVKRKLRQSKDESFRYHARGSDRILLEYPSAR